MGIPFPTPLSGHHGPRGLIVGCLGFVSGCGLGPAVVLRALAFVSGNGIGLGVTGVRGSGLQQGYLFCPEINTLHQSGDSRFIVLVAISDYLDDNPTFHLRYV